MDFIESEFKDFVTGVYDEPLNPCLQRELRRVFVAGAWCIIAEVLHRAAKLTPENATDNVVFIEDLMRECLEFRDLVVRGEA